MRRGFSFHLFKSLVLVSVLGLLWVTLTKWVGFFCLAELISMRNGDYMALPVSSDSHRRLHSRQVMPDPEVHWGPLRTGVRPNRRGGLLLPSCGDRAGEKNQTSDLGHGRTGEVQVKTDSWFLSHVSTKTRFWTINKTLLILQKHTLHMLPSDGH